MRLTDGLIIGLFITLLAAAALVVCFVCLLLFRGWRATSSHQLGARLAIVALALLFVASPYIAWKLVDRSHAISRVPESLRVAAIEYRLEKTWGFGPGGNETGFVVYRLTEASAASARKQGVKLQTMLATESGLWQPTPVDDMAEIDRWHPYDDEPGMTHTSLDHPPTIAEYLEKYGFSIPVPRDRYKEADHAIQTPGSFYSYGRGGSVTIVDPVRGKVYFAYAG